jgi:hypothetical protein
VCICCCGAATKRPDCLEVWEPTSCQQAAVTPGYCQQEMRGSNVHACVPTSVVQQVVRRTHARPRSRGTVLYCFGRRSSVEQHQRTVTQNALVSVCGSRLILQQSRTSIMIVVSTARLGAEVTALALWRFLHIAMS